MVGVLGGALPAPDVEHLKTDYKRDRLLRNIKVKNLSDGLFDGLSRLDVAEALAPTRPVLSSQLLALELERAARVSCSAKVRDDLFDVIEASPRIPEHERGGWHDCRELRNTAVHPRNSGFKAD